MATDKSKIKEALGNNVAKSNELVRCENALVQMATDRLSNAEMKILDYIISRLDTKKDKVLREISISVQEYADMMGITYSGTNYAHVYSHLDKLVERVRIPDPDNPFVEMSFSWIGDYKLNKRNGVIYLTLHNELQKHLLNLEGNFTQYKLKYVLAINRKYAFRLYEVLISYSFNMKRHSFDVSVEELRRLLGVGSKHKEFKDFKKFVLVPSVDEINSVTDLKVDFELVKRGRAVTRIIFSMHEANTGTVGIEETLAREYELDRRLNKK